MLVLLITWVGVRAYLVAFAFCTFCFLVLHVYFLCALVASPLFLASINILLICSLQMAIYSSSH